MPEDIETIEKNDGEMTETVGNTETADTPIQGKPVQNVRATRGDRPPRRGGGKRGARRGGREDRRPEFDSKIISIRRVTRVVAGGRRFSFSVALVAGDHKGRVGVGSGKASDTALAIEKAMRDAKKRMIRVPLSKHMRILHEVEAKYCASDVMLIPAAGRGLAAGGAVRTVLELAGIKDITGKILSRSKNHLNNARATVDALKKLKV